MGAGQEPIQSTPRKIVGLLKGRKVLGVAACRMASAAWTGTGVYTWGTNSGQLGAFFRRLCSNYALINQKVHHPFERGGEDMGKAHMRGFRPARVRLRHAPLR